MTKRTVLETVLGGIFGGVLGGILTLVLVFAGIGSWAVYSPIVLGGIAGFWKGDRGLFFLMQAVGNLPG